MSEEDLDARVRELLEGEEIVETTTRSAERRKEIIKGAEKANVWELEGKYTVHLYGPWTGHKTYTGLKSVSFPALTKWEKIDEMMKATFPSPTTIVVDLDKKTMSFGHSDYVKEGSPIYKIYYYVEDRNEALKIIDEIKKLLDLEFHYMEETGFKPRTPHQSKTETELLPLGRVDELLPEEYNGWPTAGSKVLATKDSLALVQAWYLISEKGPPPVTKELIAYFIVDRLEREVVRSDVNLGRLLFNQPELMEEEIRRLAIREGWIPFAWILSSSSESPEERLATVEKWKVV